jgi:uncharacterized protein YraI
MRCPFRISGLLLAVHCILRAVGDAHAGAVEVSADRVNLRACPSPDCEVVAQVSRGQVLSTLDGRENGWIEVIPPDGTVFWVYAELVSDDVSSVDDLRVRCGPGINYRPVGKVTKGGRVSTVGRDGDWLRIASPPGCSIWVSGQFVREVGSGDAPAATAVATPPPTRPWEEPAPSNTVVSIPAVPPPPPPSTTGSGLGRPVALPPAPARMPSPVATASRPAGTHVRYAGVIRPAGTVVWRRPSSFRLVANDALGRLVTRCYLTGDERQLAAREGKPVWVTGTQTAVQGVRYPVVHVEAIELRVP